MSQKNQTKLTKIMVSRLVMALLLAAGILSQILAARTDSITSVAPSVSSTSENIEGTSSLSRIPSRNHQARSTHIKAVTTEWEPVGPYMHNSRVIANPLVYTTTKSVKEREPLDFALSATDTDGDQLVYSASNLPEGASFDPNTQTFSWTPRYDQAGVYTVHFEVSDGQFTDSEDVTITVVQLYDDWDVNGDGAANVLDMVLVGQNWGETDLTGWIREDANEDGTINVLDIIIIGQHWTG
jgi:hypothetical protein